MRKIIAAINMTLDGNCDHTAGIPDEEIHQHYTALLNGADAILYGRTTYQLMEFWRPLIDRPSEQQSMNDFAVAINKIPKIVFSRSLDKVDWETARVSKHDLKQEVLALRQESGRDILVGSRSLIIQLINLKLIDEFQLCIYPVVAGPGLPLFENINGRTAFKLAKTKIFGGGAVILYYELKK